LLFDRPILFKSNSVDWLVNRVVMVVIVHDDAPGAELEPT